MQSNVFGTTMPVLEFILEPNDAIISEAGELSWMGASIQMTTHTQMAGGGGFFGAIRRVAGGGSLFMTEYRAHGAPESSSSPPRFQGTFACPGGQWKQIHGPSPRLPLRHAGGSDRGGIQQSLGAGTFGGDGFRLQHIGGAGTAWIELSSEVVTKDLRTGETLRVHPGHVGAFQAGVSFQIARIPGISNMIFGGDGIFLAALTGPGRVWLQSLPISKLAHALMEYLPSGREQRTETGVVGGIVGSILGGMK